MPKSIVLIPFDVAADSVDVVRITGGNIIKVDAAIETDQFQAESAGARLQGQNPVQKKLTAWPNIEGANVVRANSSTLRQKIGELKKQDDQLYVVGHGDNNRIYSFHMDKSVTIEQLKQLLEANGLNKKFSGRVKIFACRSGVATGAAEGTSSFAESFGNTMWQAGWVNLRVVGYKSNLEAFMGTGASRKAGSVVDENGVKQRVSAQSLQVVLLNPNPPSCCTIM